MFKQLKAKHKTLKVARRKQALIYTRTVITVSG